MPGFTVLYQSEQKVQRVMASLASYYVMNLQSAGSWISGVVRFCPLLDW
jgi:hypothetical protein